MIGVKKKVEISLGIPNTNRRKMYYWSPQKLKELKEKGYKLRHMTLREANHEYDLTNKKKCDKENNDEKIQSKINRTRY
tara:strand:+ start:153 stop:389 length:237 start_codon:yes stop_codon:yes gene_type:complete